MQYVIDSNDLCNCINCKVHIIKNSPNTGEPLIAKIYLNPNDPNYQNEHHIFQILLQAQNTTNIVRLRNININLNLGDEFGPNPRYLLFEFLNHEKLSKYIDIDNNPQFTEEMVKFIGYRLLLDLQTLHNHHIVHNKLDIENIMLNQTFDPIIIHFKDAVDNVNQNNEFNDDFESFAKILAKLITNGKFVNFEIGINSQGKRCYMIRDLAGRLQKLTAFWTAANISIPTRISTEFIKFFNLLIKHNNLNFNILLKHPWLNGINHNQNIQNETRNYLSKLYGRIEENKKKTCIETINLSDVIKEEDQKEENVSLYDKIGMKSDSEKTLNEIFSELSIRKIKFKPDGISNEYLIIEILNFNYDYSFLNKFMFKFYLILQNMEVFEGFTIKADKPKENSFLSFTVNIDLVEEQNSDEDEILDEDSKVPDYIVDENDDNEQTLIMDLELVRYRDNQDNNEFYLLFNYKQGEISYYYLLVKKFKEKAKSTLKSFLGQN